MHRRAAAAELGGRHPGEVFPRKKVSQPFRKHEFHLQRILACERKIRIVIHARLTCPTPDVHCSTLRVLHKVSKICRDLMPGGVSREKEKCVMFNNSTHAIQVLMSLGGCSQPLSPK